ncbi:TniQ family protein [Nocardia sp. NPDC051981]|uniref:TniQ family protein n=1 Tax=Nocardia sp. NPDC051981 TaxID=3155417 RepID=UPI0034414A9A
MNDNLTPLPIRLRPLRGETAESYVIRLAVANHLPPSYLRRLITPGRRGMGAIDPDKLAAVSARSTEVILRIFDELAARRRPNAPEPPPNSAIAPAATPKRNGVDTRPSAAITKQGCPGAPSNVSTTSDGTPSQQLSRPRPRPRERNTPTADDPASETSPLRSTRFWPPIPPPAPARSGSTYSTTTMPRSPTPPSTPTLSTAEDPLDEPGRARPEPLGSTT